MSSPSSRPVRTAKVFLVGCLSTLALLQVIDWLPFGAHEQLARMVVLVLAAAIIPVSSVVAWFFVLTPKGLIRDEQVAAQESVNRAPSSVIEQNWRSSTPSQQDSQQPVVASAPGDMPQPAHLSSSLGAIAPDSHDDVTRPLIDPVNISRWRLVIETGPEAGSQFPLKEAMLAGRAPYADLLLQSARISREHARFSIENGAPMVNDLASRNGTHVNGRRITAPQRLEAGDEVRLHDVIIRVMQRDVATNA